MLLYGYVATDFGKRDAEDQTNDFMDDPDITIINRILLRPELLTMGTPRNYNSSADGTEPAADNAAAKRRMVRKKRRRRIIRTSATSSATVRITRIRNATMNS